MALLRRRRSKRSRTDVTTDTFDDPIIATESFDDPIIANKESFEDPFFMSKDD